MVRLTCSPLRLLTQSALLPTPHVFLNIVSTGLVCSNGPKSTKVCRQNDSILFSADQLDIYVEKKLDTDDPEHIEWLYQKAVGRAADFDIEGVTWPLTQGVVKNIIPAIASTNAIIAGQSNVQCLRRETRQLTCNASLASCCNEAFKLATTCAPSLDNYMMVCTADE